MVLLSCTEALVLLQLLYAVLLLVVLVLVLLLVMLLVILSCLPSAVASPCVLRSRGPASSVRLGGPLVCMEALVRELLTELLCWLLRH